MAKRRVIRQTKSGSWMGSTKAGQRSRRGRAVPRLSNREHRNLGTLQSKHRAAAHTRRKAGR